MIKKTANILTVGSIALILILICALESSAANYLKCAENKISIETDRNYASDNTSIKIPTTDGNIVSLNINNLSYLWKTDLGGKIVSDVFEQSNSIYVVTRTVGDKNSGNLPVGQNVLWVLDKETGLITQKINLAQSDDYYFFGYGNAVIIVTTTGKILTYEHDRSLKSERNSNLTVTQRPILNEGILYLPSKNAVYTFNLISAAVSQIITQTTIINKLTVHHQTNLITGDVLGNITYYSGSKAKVLWRFRAGGQILNLMPTEDTILTSSVDGFIYSLSGKGKLRWKHRLEERLNGELFLTENSIIFGQTNRTFLSIIDYQNGRTTKNLEIGDSPYFGSITSASKRLMILTKDKFLLYSAENCF